MMRISCLLFVNIVLIHLEHSQAGLFDSLRGAIADATGIDLGGANEQSLDEPRFYKEDRLANAVMMADFIDTPLYLVAFFKWRSPLAVYQDGRETNLTGFEADRIYTQAMFSDIVPGVGGEVKFFSNVEEASIVVDTSSTEDQDDSFHMEWDAMAVIEFPSGLAFGRMLTNQRFQALSPHKKAGLEYHAIFACELIPGSSMDAGLNTTSDAPVAMVDLLDYSNGNDGAYSATEVDTETNHEMRTAAAFRIKHSLIQESDGWDEVRINTFPSHAALEATIAHSQKAMVSGTADGFQRASSFQVSPVFVNSLGGNAQASYLEACDSERAKTTAATQEYDLSTFCP